MAKDRSRRKRHRFLVNRLMIYGPKAPLAIRIDSTHTALYVRLTREGTAKTVEVESEVLADYDSQGRLVGFEVIGFEAPHRRARVPGVLPGAQHPTEHSEAYELEAALA